MGYRSRAISSHHLFWISSDRQRNSILVPRPGWFANLIDSVISLEQMGLGQFRLHIPRGLSLLVSLRPEQIAEFVAWVVSCG